LVHSAHISGTHRLYSITCPPLNFTFRPRLLHVDVDRAHPPPENEKEHDLHRDERQIRLDTDRSFVLYPVGDVPSTPAIFHRFSSCIIDRWWSGRCKACTSGRTQQTHRTTFPTSSRIELLSSRLPNNLLFSFRCLTRESRVSMISPPSFSLLYPPKLLFMRWKS
jgi:hypothetical protein